MCFPSSSNLGYLKYFTIRFAHDVIDFNIPMHNIFVMQTLYTLAYLFKNDFCYLLNFLLFVIPIRIKTILKTILISIFPLKIKSFFNYVYNKFPQAPNP
jgi:hypothetical protein